MSSINTNPERFYYIINKRLALIEKDGIQTTDNGSTSCYCNGHLEIEYT